MATRFGMADGRMTNNVSNKIYMDQLQQANNVDGNGFRELSHQQGTKIIGNPFAGFAQQPQPWLAAKPLAPSPYSRGKTLPFSTN